ncbi:hypothetical protein DERF_003029 [Dermatophagoides farinae]|uniref:Uncharacterized protein n=1 Tax=Dermatophagoides farinae TaxID=6954 RepID=A0A922IE99_DERFA|nr:hypothetical protein DERF_003029 [Dermatophagoides farinae]
MNPDIFVVVLFLCTKKELRMKNKIFLSGPLDLSLVSTFLLKIFGNYFLPLLSLLLPVRMCKQLALPSDQKKTHNFHCKPA